MHSYSSLAKTWLSIIYETGFLPGLKFSTITLYLCSECADERPSISKAVLEIEANTVIYIHTYIHIHTYTHTYTTYIHTYTHTHIHTHIHTYRNLK